MPVESSHHFILVLLGVVDGHKASRETSGPPRAKHTTTKSPATHMRRQP